MSDNDPERDDWPLLVEDVTADGMMRIIGTEAMLVDTAKNNLSKAKPMADFTGDERRIHYLSIMASLYGTGLMQALKVARDVDPELAEELARTFWLTCESGDPVEYLWELLVEAGVDPERLRTAQWRDQTVGDQ
jgi:hypothetical protein